MTSEERMKEMGFRPSDLEMLVGMSQDVYGPDEFSEAVQFYLNQYEAVERGGMSEKCSDEEQEVIDALEALGGWRLTPHQIHHSARKPGRSRSCCQESPKRLRLARPWKSYNRMV